MEEAAAPSTREGEVEAQQSSVESISQAWRMIPRAVKEEWSANAGQGAEKDLRDGA